jgi:[acyl-carrier-protein] S-malonyltransferase
LNGVNFNDLKIPLINNADVNILTTGEEAKASLIRQMQASVKWEASIRKLIDLGVDTFIEIGPGKVLTGMLKRIDRDVKGINIFDIDSLEEAVKELV